MLSEAFKFVESYFAEVDDPGSHASRLREPEYLSVVKTALKFIARELRLTLDETGQLELPITRGGAGSGYMDRTGKIICHVADCEGSWTEPQNIESYFDFYLYDLSDARIIAKALNAHHEKVSAAKVL